MCGIIAYSGHRPGVPVCIEGLKRLEYRGYDSSGVAFLKNNKIDVIKTPGKISALEDALAEAGNVFNATSAMGHTRWATHGVPNQLNAHPHQDDSGSLALVHNGIIENFFELKTALAAKGHIFKTETDTEVLANLIAEELKDAPDMAHAISRALGQCEGTYAITVIHKDHPGMIWGVRKASPLVAGIGIGEFFLASDVPAFLPYTKEVVFLDDGELVQIDASSMKVMDAASLAVIEKESHTITWDVQAAQKGGFKHFMLKEIFEQPKVITDCLTGRINKTESRASLPEIADMPLPGRLHIVACGTSFHAGLWSEYLFEGMAKLPVDVDIASEFRYRDLIFEQGDLVMVISQSGETLDTLEALRVAKAAGVPVLGLCNVVGSTIARESDYVLYTQAGPEISVASTKAMCSQLTMLFILALYWGEKRGVLDQAARKEAVGALTELPPVLEAALPEMRETARTLSRAYSEATSFLYLGRGQSYPLAMEGALKLKEISYIHAEGYAAGEMKHGPIALIDPKFPTFALALDDRMFPKVKSNLIEVQARGGLIIALTHPGLDLDIDNAWIIPKVWGPLNVFLALPALQLFAYEMADYLGKDVDQPRNLAKSVTVE